MTSQEIRQQFIDFFVQKHGHTFVPSSPVVPHDDPTLLFTNAGMNQFKPIFLGQEKRAYTRAVNTQKCIRAGGKHNDLDDVGRSRRHHTFFEMLGNWSFGDYFKRGAIEMAWELLTKVWKLDPTRLHVSCYEGNQAAGIPRDTEAADIWKQVAGMPDDHIHYFGKDNFWEMGDTGPCGPCTEIYYDRTPDKSGGKSVNGDDPRVMEIWNNVFIQYNRDASGKLTTLPSQHVDTGMGLERICQVLQGKEDNFGTDLWTPLFEKISEISNLKYTGLFPPTNAADPVAEAANPQLRHDIAFRVIADHARCLTFALTDGAVPSNEGRGSVLRRILRRAAFFGRQHLNLREVFLYQLVPVVVEAMGAAFPELRHSPSRVAEIIKNEELAFDRTIDRGLALFADASKKGAIAGGEAFELHATYGFPIDLTEIIGAERGIPIDKEGYEVEFKKHQQISQGADREATTRLWEVPPDVLAAIQMRGIASTDDSAKFDATPIRAIVKAIWDGHKLIDHTHGAAAAEHGVAVILDRTNFYAEMGGQVGDPGELRSGRAVMAVTTARAAGGFVLHVGRMVEGHLSVGDHVTATLEDVRQRTEKNHTTTHLANWALRETLGDDVQQKGSLVDPEKLRFDFSHGKSMTDDELAKVETLVNEGIAKKLPVYAQTAPQELALKIHGLRAVFGEKYPPLVRVVSVGVPVEDLLKDPANPKWRQYSVEFCGGTHLQNTGEASQFAITSEESVSKGIRRIVALTGDAAKHATEQAALVDDLIVQAKSIADADVQGLITALQKALAAGNLPLRAKRRGQAAVGELQSRYKAWEKANRWQGGGAGVDVVAVAGELLASAQDLGGGKIVVGEIPGADDEGLRKAMDSLRKKTPSHGILLGAAGDGKVSFVAAVSDDLIARGLKAGDWIRETAKIAGGGGGGRPQMAQAGGKDPAKLLEALEKARTFVQSVVK